MKVLVTDLSKGFRAFRICTFCDAYIKRHQPLVLPFLIDTHLPWKESPPSARSAAHGVRLLTAEPPPLDVLVLVFCGLCPQPPSLPPSLAVCFCPLDEGWNPLTGENTAFL